MAAMVEDVRVRLIRVQMSGGIVTSAQAEVAHDVQCDGMNVEAVETKDVWAILTASQKETFTNFCALIINA